MTRKPNDKIFKEIIRHTPLVSIDLLVQNKSNFLIGKRAIDPAKNFWFTPGGRILKDETISEAFERITFMELGKSFPIKEAIFHGNYEHHHPNNFFSEEFTTHYIVMCYFIPLNESIVLPKDQHTSFKWIDKKSIIDDNNVHHFVKDYFLKDAGQGNLI